MYRGAKYSMLGVSTPNDAYHGYDGLGDVTLEGVDPLDVEKMVQTEPAASAICGLVSLHPGVLLLSALYSVARFSARNYHTKGQKLWFLWFF